MMIILRKRTFFARYEKVNGLVSDVYAAAKKADRPLVFFEHFSNSAITDECEGTNVEGNITNNFNNGAWNPNSLPGSFGQYWEALYEGIRKANLIIENVQKYNTPDNPQQDGDLRNRIGEMYFMRGYFHMLLMRMYGEAPYIDRVINAGDNMDFKKESVHSMAEKIVTDAQTAYGMVPNKYVKTSENFGRVDKGACLGLISFVRWVAATPLWNGASQYGYNLRRVFEDEYAYDATRWRKAKEAAKAVLDFEVGGTKRYSLYTKHDANDFKDPADGNLNDSRVYARLWDMFYDMDAFANEYVFFMTKSKDQAWQGDIYPPSREGSSRQQPVQEQVDEYEYIVGDYGYPVYSAEARKGGYDDANPYVKGTRDPRFYRDVIYHELLTVITRTSRKRSIPRVAPIRLVLPMQLLLVIIYVNSNRSHGTNPVISVSMRPPSGVFRSLYIFMRRLVMNWERILMKLINW